MFVVITGGSASGKSEYAEDTAIKLVDKEANKYYIATMQPYGKETIERINKHKQNRKNKGFVTIECFYNLEDNVLDKVSNKDTVLLECMSNLLANNMYSKKTKTIEKMDNYIIKQVVKLKNRCKNLIVVTNEVFSDGCSYDKSTLEYISNLGSINTNMTKLADKVYEIVYSIPVCLK